MKEKQRQGSYLEDELFLLNHFAEELKLLKMKGHPNVTGSCSSYWLQLNQDFLNYQVLIATPMVLQVLK